MKIDQDKIDRTLDNRATSDEMNEVLGWLETDEGHDYAAKRLSDEADGLTTQTAGRWLDHDVPSDRMRNRFHRAIHHSRRMPWQWIAAVIIPIVILGGSLGYFMNKTGVLSPTEYTEFVVPSGEQMQVILQDGTVVQLNGCSKLRSPRSFGLFSRKISFSGEAYFTVAKDKSRPFIIDLKDIDVEVTGTKFNVKSYEGDDIIQVTLDEGGVVLKQQQRIDVLCALRPGEQALYNRSSSSFSITKTQDPKAVEAWRSNSLNFYREPLSEILKTLNRQYDINFRVADDSIMHIRYTLSTSKVQIEDILKDLEIVSTVVFTKQPDGSYDVAIK